MLLGTDLPHEDKVQLLEVEKASKQQWRESNVKKATDYLRASLLDQLDFPSSDHRKSIAMTTKVCHRLLLHQLRDQRDASSIPCLYW
jgi:hypothetical protein